ncbi:hypothetical protein DPMN_177293 [Dreissena polymorpha]|nr:hypothetical protein DPMN_177293 [Dreissena polymorpha]
MDEIIASSEDVVANGDVTSVEQKDARDKSDSEKDGMKPEVTSTCSLSDEGSMD